ncbi:hypothetical protein SUGI_0252780 [Cryptomeria japonica]|uniref:uncharacterized protein LOC131076513 n=1 Tax=Cryptomeria japonica TaxID=3369 RepID=UPI002408E86A|nr:uncharacterized protein LOC131076513 [Cryptomeria japonica]GLJ15400.1 hypothetical protein SUGI_0252780 [Cryptomeria japonica]
MAALCVTAELVGLPGLKVNLHWPRSNRACLHGTGRRRTHSLKATVDPQSCIEKEDRTMSTEAFHQFISLSQGSWNGSFCQYDIMGNAMQRVNTNLAVTSYGEDELVSLMQTLKIKQAPPKTSILGGHTEPEWEEYKLRETNLFTIDNHEQIGFFPEGKAFSLRHQSADVVDKVLRVGVLGEDDVDEEFPKNLKVPPRRPSVVSESCLYSMDKNRRMRAFHILNQHGIVDMIGVFQENKEREITSANTFDYYEKKNEDRINALLGRWLGHSVTKRSGFYGSTIAEADIDLKLQMDDNGRLIQDINTISGGGSNVHWTGNVEGGCVTFDGGFQMTLLPGDMYLAFPQNVAKSVAESQSFHLEFSWMEFPGKRRRLLRTYDAQGLVVSTTYINEVKV